MPRQFPRMIWAETLKTFTRGSGIAALAIAFAVGFLTVAAIWGVQHSGVELNGADASEVIKVTGVEVAGYALKLRNFFVLPLFLLLSAASAVAGEYGDRTLRELTVRPVPRWSVLLAKLIALSALSAVTLVITLGASLGPGLGLFGQGAAEIVPVDAPGILDVVAGYAATWLSDIGLLSIGIMASLFIGSVGGVVVAVVMVLMADKALYLVLLGAAQFGVSAAASLVPWTLGNALACWEEWSGAWNPAQFAALATYSAISFTIAVARFHRMDVP